MTMIQPEKLKDGDLILITATARKITHSELKPALDWIELNGWKWELAPGLDAEEHQFAGSDEIRRKALQWCLDHPTAKAIWCARGGYGTARILDGLNWSHFLSKPKWIAGYSDVTALHGEVQNRGIQSLHAPMLLGFDTNTTESRDSVAAAFRGQLKPIQAKAHSLNLPGRAKGKLVGGNLSVLYSNLGSTSQPPLEGNILFIEDLDEYLYHIDRMMLNLGRNGWWKRISGLVVGGMTDMNDNAIPFGETSEEIIARHLKPHGIPVAFGVPAGHINDNRTLAFGSEVELQVEMDGASVNF